MKIVKFLLSFTLLICGLSYAEGDKCSNNFKNAVINNTQINQINIVCGDKKPMVPKFHGWIQPMNFRDFKENGLSKVDNLAEFILNNEGNIVYLDISPFYTDEQRDTDNFTFPSKSNRCFGVPTVPNVSEGTEYCFDEEPDFMYDSRGSARRIWGYFILKGSTGPRQGWMSVALKSIPEEKVFAIYAGKPEFKDETQKIGLSFEQVLKKYDLSAKEVTPKKETHLPSFQNIIPDTKCALIIASRTNILEAKLYLQQKVSDKRYANIYQVKNGRYAISVGLLNVNDKDSIIGRWKAEGKIPSDSFCAKADFLTKEIKF